MRLLAIDQGTTSTRAIVLHGDRLHALGQVVHQQYRPRPGWVEHDPQELLGAIEALIEQALAGGQKLDGFAIAHQGESCLAWDKQTLEPLTPVMVWQDQRGHTLLEAMRQDGRLAQVESLSGLPGEPYFSASRWVWALANVESVAHARRFGRLCLGTCDTWFRHRLTGRFETDVASASRTLLLERGQADWSAQLCALFGIDPECLPAITPSAGELGWLGHDRGAIPLLASIVDQQAALVGHQCTRPGQVKITWGTGAFAMTPVAQLPSESLHGTLPTIAWQIQGQAVRWAVDGGLHTAAAAVDWAIRQGILKSHDELHALGGTAAAERGLYFVPALAGLACPHWDAQARGAFIGLDLACERHDLVKAILEGLAFRMAQVIDAIGQVEPIRGAIRVDGGLSASGYLMQFLADCLQRPLQVAQDPQVTARGLIQLSLAGLGQQLVELPTQSTVIDPGRSVAAWCDCFARATLGIRKVSDPT